MGSDCISSWSLHIFLLGVFQTIFGNGSIRLYLFLWYFHPILRLLFRFVSIIIWNIQVRFINLIPMQFFHKSLHTPLCIPTSAARYLMSKILTITAGINQQSMLNLPVKVIAKNIEQQKFCGRMNLS